MRERVAQRPVVSLDAKGVASGAWPLMPVLHAGDCFMAGTSYFVELWSYSLAGNLWGRFITVERKIKTRRLALLIRSTPAKNV